MNANLKAVGRPNVPDLDAEETTEWLEALQAVIERDGPERAHHLLEHLVDSRCQEVVEAFVHFSMIPLAVSLQLLLLHR